MSLVPKSQATNSLMRVKGMREKEAIPTVNSHKAVFHKAANSAIPTLLAIFCRTYQFKKYIHFLAPLGCEGNLENMN